MLPQDATLILCFTFYALLCHGWHDDFQLMSAEMIARRNAADAAGLRRCCLPMLRQMPYAAAEGCWLRGGEVAALSYLPIS